jgi:hypothetical protein
MGRKRDLKLHRSVRRKQPKTWCLVYALREAVGGPIRYVGQTRNEPQERLRWHYKELARHKAAGRRLSPVKSWLDGLPSRPLIEVIDEAGTWDISEAVWIDRLRHRGEPLLNVASVVP